MSARLLALVAFVTAAIWASSCSTGLGKDPRRQPPTANASVNANLPFGLDVGVVPTLNGAPAPIGEPAITGILVPGIGATPAREVLLLAFTTAAAADDADGNGTPLARDATTDGNDASDVFVAVIDETAVEPRAFSQSLAGKFRHPRCATCHSMQVAGTLAFASSPLPHAGPPPGPTFPNNDPATCAPCHVSSNQFPVEGWMAPAASFDIRSKTVAQLALMAQNVPADDTEHFVSDKRVLWALDSGVLPQVGGRNGVADDDHDGVLEPEDTDGVPRTVPGGSAAFLQQIEDWHDSGMVVTTAAAVRDVTLVSRAAGTSNAGNGASAAPRIQWVPNPAFDPANFAATNPLGTLYVAFESDATNLVAGDTNGATDVFRAAVELHLEQDAVGTPTAGGLDLVAANATILCSARNGLATPGNGASRAAAIGGDDAELIAFESEATNLIAAFTDNNGSGTDVFLRNVGPSGLGTSTLLVSHQVGNAAAGGDGASARPALSDDGSAIAFESDAGDDLMVGATDNGVRDVFYATTTGGSPFTKVAASVTDTGGAAAGGDSRNASVHAAGSRVRVAFESDATNLDASATAPTNVYVFDSQTGSTTLLNQRVSPGVTAAGDGSARAPQFLPDGSAIAFESDASNIDVLREADGNGTTDVFLVETAQIESGRVLPFRISTTVAEAADADGASTGVVVGSFSQASPKYPTGIAAYLTAATNLGTSDASDVMVAFLAESSGILADFRVVTATGGPVPLTVTFEDLSSGNPTAWAWDFDNDGTIDSTEQNPTHVYTVPGDYTVTLVASNANTEGTSTKVDQIHTTGPLTVDFTAEPATAGGTPLTVLFRDASVEANGTILSWAWDFDDDGTVDSTERNPSHVFTTEGTFSVSLTAHGEFGPATATKVGFVTVTAPGPLVANFTSIVTASPIVGRTGTAVGGVYDDETVEFTDTSTGTVTSRLWNFGDGTTATGNPVTHTFATGTYDVVLTVTGPDGVDSEVRPQGITAIGGETTVEIAASQDTSIYSEDTNNSNGANVRIVCGNAAFLDTTPPIDPPAQQGVRRALLEFDVAAAVPATSVIRRAQLQLTSSLTFTNPTGAQTISLRRLTQSWGEGSTNGGIGGGTDAVAGDATWASRFQGGAAWTTAGGSMEATVSGSRSVDGTGTYEWDSDEGGNSGMAVDVQLWLDTPSSNHGWCLRSGEVSGTRTTKVFDSRESGPGSVPPGVPPKLIVTFRPPLP